MRKARQTSDIGIKEKITTSASLRRYVAGIRSEVERTERALHLTGAVLEQWSAAQRDWLWLDCIFAAPDIQRQLPHEAKAFANADRALRDAARRAAERPNALQAATAPGEPAVKRQGTLWCRTLPGCSTLKNTFARVPGGSQVADSF